VSRIFHDIQVGLDEELEEKLKWLNPQYSHYQILRKSVDARRGHEPRFVYSVELFNAGEPFQRQVIHLQPVAFKGRPVNIIGSGPAGLFAALRLIERGIPCRLFEQGSTCEKRLMAITRFWRYGQLNPKDNVGFGEGGAGLYSDGKLITRIKSPHIPYVMQRLVQFGAPAEIEFLANPHVGSDRIRKVIPVLREHLKSKGCEIHFNTKISRLLTSGGSVIGVESEDGRLFQSDRTILACGHSAEDVFQHLAEMGVFMEGKSFAVGLRIEHPQADINKMQYREHAQHPKLEAANYKIAFTDAHSKVGVYSFCMCPGGYVLSSGTDTNGVVSNGMSNYKRNSAFANSAIVVSIDYKKTFGEDVFAGLNYRRLIEASGLDMVRKAGGTKELPAQNLMDFLDGKLSPTLPKSSCPSGVVATPLHELLGDEFRKHFVSGLKRFEEVMRGFVSNKALLHGVESRTSCPIRITRDPETFQSVSHSGLYPAGEGAGYAGGITSAACDGIEIAERIATEVSSQVTSKL